MTQAPRSVRVTFITGPAQEDSVGFDDPVQACEAILERFGVKLEGADLSTATRPEPELVSVDGPDTRGGSDAPAALDSEPIADTEHTGGDPTPQPDNPPDA